MKAEQTQEDVFDFDVHREQQGYLKNLVTMCKITDQPLDVAINNIGDITRLQIKDGLMQLLDMELLSPNQYEMARKLYSALAALSARPAPMALEVGSHENYNSDDTAEDVKDRARATIKSFMDYGSTMGEREVLRWVETLGDTQTRLVLNREARCKADLLASVLGRMVRQ